MAGKSIKGFHFYENGRKWLARGVTYGPFRLQENGGCYPAQSQIRLDFEAMAEMGANSVRLYIPPEEELAAIADECGIQLLIDVPWPVHLDVYNDLERQTMCLREVEEGITRIRSWPNVLGVHLGNEVPADLVRWAGPRRVERFLCRLYERAKELAPSLSVGYANFPSTEYLRLDHFDFVSFNVYLENVMTFRDYVTRLRLLYPEKPLVLSELGMDSKSNGKEQQQRLIWDCLRESFQAGAAGAFVFAWTDEWHTGGWDMDGWAFGVVDKNRNPKPAYSSVASVYQSAPQCIDVGKWPSVSVVVATYNGASTLKACLDSLLELEYPDFEIVVVDDGSTDGTSQILAQYSGLKIISQPNQGLSAARNTGIAASEGDIIAFTDSDCVADADWLFHLVVEMKRGGYWAAGGPNLSPQEDAYQANCVAMAPGHASHVLFNSHEAEHVPGCNMAFRKSVLTELNGFDPQFHKAGDDVDIAWRILDSGGRIGFCPSAFVWHHRRQSFKKYWKQQAGYGEAEALLHWKHPHRFNERGLSLWQGRIYSGGESRSVAARPLVRYGVFASAGFQCVYERDDSYLAHFLVSVEWWVFCAVFALAGLWASPAMWLAVVGIAASLAVSGLRAWRKCAERKNAIRFFLPVWALWMTQPLARGLSRYWFRLKTSAPPPEFEKDLQAARVPGRLPTGLGSVAAYWGESGAERLDLLNDLVNHMTRQGWLCTPNNEWEPWDLTVASSWWFKTRLVSSEENHGEKKRLFRLRYRLQPTSLLYGMSLGAWLLSASVAMGDSVLARGILIVWLGVVWILFRRGLRGRALVEKAADSVVRERGFQRLHEEIHPRREHSVKPAPGDSRERELQIK